jgi:hypothetical protein
MENLNIEETKSTPEVIGDNVNGTLKIKGNCFPENSLSFFDTINNWIDSVPSDLPSFSLDCELNYIASSSVMHFFKIMQKIEDLFPVENIEIKWKYEIDDEDIQKLGEEFSKLTKSKVELIPLEV